MELTPDTIEVLNNFHKSFNDSLAKSMGKEGWTYRDLPNMLPEYMEKLVGWLGEDEYTFITFAERTWPDGVRTVRGQILISPKGIENLKNADLTEIYK